MNEPSAPSAANPANTTPSTQSSGFVQRIPTLEERSAAIFGNDTSSETAGDTDAGTAPPPEQPAGSTAASVDDAAKRAADRQARLAALKAQERASVDSQQRHRESETLRQQLAAAQKRADEAERIAQQRFDVDKLDETSFFDLARRAKVSPERLAEHLRESMSNPEYAATHAVNRAVDPAIKAMEKKLADQQAVIDRFLTQQQQSSMEAQEAAATREFIGYAQQNATDAPYAANFRSKFGPEQFATLAQSASASVPPGAGWQAVLDVIEENLSSMAQIYAPPGADPQRSQAPPKQSPAAAKAPTISNSLAQERASVVDNDNDWGAISFEERSKRVFG